MKNNFILRIFCVLLLLTISNISIGNQIRNIDTITDNFVSNNIQIDAPIWEIGERWTYEISHTLSFSTEQNIMLRMTVLEISYEVIDDSDSFYTLDFSGKVIAQIVKPDDIIHLNKAKIKGTEKIDKINLGISKIYSQIISTSDPIYELFINISFNPSFSLMNFPLTVGKTWEYPDTNVNVIIENSEYSNPRYFKIRSGIATCSSYKNISVRAGTFKAYEIIVDREELTLYFTPTVKNLIKAEGKLIGIQPPFNIENQFDFISSLNLELLDTTNDHPEAPNIPDPPFGPTYGNPGKEYNFISLSNDQEGDKIKFGWDWDGDYYLDEWSTFLESGQNIQMKHQWQEIGEYDIRVKCMDNKNHESSWSETSTIIIGDNQPPETPIIDGPKSGKINKEISFEISTIDPENDNVYFTIDWGEGSQTNWIGPKNSGSIINVKNTWTNQNTYSIKVKAKDIFGGESDWSYHDLTVAKHKTKNLFYQFFNHPIFSQIIKLII